MFDQIVHVFIVLSLISFSVETLPNLSEDVTTCLAAIEVITVLFFTAEYLLRLLVSEPKHKYAFSFFGIVDLVAILPFYLCIGFDGRTIRVLRLLRLFRVLKIGRYSGAIQRYHRALSIAKEELALFFLVAAILLYFAAVGIYYRESDVQPKKFGSGISLSLVGSRHLEHCWLW